jgi:arylsulfatase A-like enzyme
MMSKVKSIDSRTFFLCLFVFFVAVANTHGAAESEHTNPNIIVILIDDLGWKDLGCYGSTYYQTPNIDRLASQGVRFTDGYAACAVCSPTRASILTGKYPARLMLTEWLPSGRWDPNAKLRSGRFLRMLPLEETTLAEALREAGYRTGIIGKWHLGGEPFSTPAHHGFDVNIAGNDHGNPGEYFFPYKGEWKIPTTGLKARWQLFEDGEEGEYLTDRLTEEAVKFISEPREQPFFLYFSHYAVHTPLQAKKSMIAKYESIPKDQRQGKPVYAAMLESADESVGRVMQTLDDLDIAEDSLVIFTSDNGGFARATKHDPLRGNKGAYYEGGIRVPFIVRWPGVTKAGHVSSVPIITNDIYPTCLAAAGLPPHPAQHRDGLDLRPVLEGGEKLDRTALFWHYPHYNSHPSSVPSSVIREGDWKLIQTFDPVGLELYHLGNDLGETSNLVSAELEKTAELLGKLQAWRREVGAEMMEPNPDYVMPK